MEFEDLYQEIILDHYKRPQNYGEIDSRYPTVEHENPVCGDQIKLGIKLTKDGIVEDIKFNGKGCAISMASASMMTEALIGKSKIDVKKAIDDVVGVLRNERNMDILDNYGDLAALKGVSKFPVRVKCATLAWHALEEAVKNEEEK
jgi:nitrogen fixation protein NifU and related proteins